MLDMKTFTGVQRFCIAGIGIILLFALLVSRCEAQTGIIRFPQWYEGNGDPVGSSLTTFPGLANGAAYKNRLTGDKFYFKNGTVKWVKDNTIGLPTKGDTGPQGPIGPQGPPGSGGGGSGTWINGYLKIDLTRIEVAAYPTTGTISEAGVLPSVYVGKTFSSSDNFNWANLQYAIYLNKTTAKPIISYGNFAGIAKDIVADWDHFKLSWDGQGMTNVSTFSIAALTVLNRVDATASTWQTMISNTTWLVQNINFYMQGSNIGMDIQMQNNSTFYNLKFIGGQLGIKANFCIETRFEKINLGEIAQGISLDNAEYTGGGTVGTGSVKNTFRDIHYANAQNNGQYAIKLRACESTSIDGIIVEGAHVKYGIYMDGVNNGNFRMCMIRNVYGEDCHTSFTPCTGVGEAMIHIANWSSGNISIDGIKGLFPNMMVNATTSGNLVISVSQVPWFENLGGKLFSSNVSVSTANIRWKFYDISHDHLPNPIINSFTGNKPVTTWWKTSATQDQPVNTVMVY